MVQLLKKNPDHERVKHFTTSNPVIFGVMMYSSYEFFNDIMSQNKVCVSHCNY